jgi:hypothetical protein
MSAEAEKVTEDDEKPSVLTMDMEVLRKTCNYALIKVRALKHRCGRARAPTPDDRLRLRARWRGWRAA